MVVGIHTTVISDFLVVVQKKIKFEHYEIINDPCLKSKKLPPRDAYFFRSKVPSKHPDKVIVNLQECLKKDKRANKSQIKRLLKIMRSSKLIIRKGY